METFHKDVAGIIPGVMALGLVGGSAKVADDFLKGKGKPEDFLKSSINVLVGVPIIGATAGAVAGL